MRRHVVLAGFLALLTASCYGSRPVARGHLGQPPIHEPEGYLCPGGYTFRAYEHVFFPPTHPALPSYQTRPRRCFSSAAQAIAGGYHLAPTPRGDLLLGGVYLAPADPEVRRLCQRAASGLGFPVPCPSLLPSGSTLGGACAPCHGYFGLTFYFTGPPGYVGVPSSEAGQPGSGHLNVWAIPVALNSGPNGGLVGCAESEIGGATALGHPAVWMVCPRGSGIDSGHVVLRWRSGGIEFGVSLHGDTALNRQLVLAVVAHVRLIT